MIQEGLGATDRPSQRESRKLMLDNIKRSRELYRSQPEEARSLAAAAYKIACEISDTGGKAESLLEMAAAEHVLSNYNTAERYSRQALTIARTLNDNELISDALHKLAGLELEAGDQESAIQLAHQALEIRESLELRIKTSDTLNILSHFYIRQADYARALEACFRSLALLELEKNLWKQSVVLTTIGNIYFEIGSHAKALSYYQQSSQLGRQVNDLAGAAGAYYHIARAHMHLGRDKEARSSFLRALALYRSLNEQLGQVTVLNKLVLLDIQEANFNRAEANSLTALEMARAISHRTAELDALTALADVEYIRDHLDRARDLYLAALPTAEEMGNLRARAHILESLAAIAEKRSDNTGALAFYKAYSKARIELTVRENDQTIRALEAKAVIDQLEQERQALSEETNRLRSEAEFRNAELTSLALHLVEKRNFLEEMKLLIEQHAGSDPASILRGIRRKVETELGSEEDWQVFEKQFSQVHQGFMRLLADRYPSLTSTELKICALLKINLSSKRIAQILHISSLTVDTHRKRIRNKIGLGDRNNLTSFLAGL